MTISISVKSQNESLRDSIRTELNNLLPLSDYSLGEKLPDFGIEVIVEDVSFGFISNEKVEKLLKLLNSKDTQSSSIYISVIYVIYYYLWDHIINLN